MSSDSRYTSWVWDHFLKPTPDDPGRAECKLCIKKIVYKGSPSALSKHLTGVHKLLRPTQVGNDGREDFVDTPDDEAGTSRGRQHDGEGHGGEHSGHVQGPAPKRPRVAERPLSQERQEAVSQAIAMLIATCQLPISIVDTEGFTAFMKVLEPAYKVLCAETTRKRIHALYAQVRDDVQAALRGLDAVSLTTDCWTSRALDSYMSLTAHAITKAWRLCRYTLCTEGLEESHSGDNLAMALLDMCHAWDLEGRTTSVTRDNASNIVNAVDNLLDFGVEFNVSCAAHTLQLCVDDALKTNQVFKAACKKAKRVVAHFHHSTKATTALERAQSTAGVKEVKLVQSCATRWDSTYFMCKSLVESRTHVRAVLADRAVTTVKQSKALLMTTEEWDELEAMLPVLKPLQVATTVLCAEDKVTISTVRPIVRSLLDVHYKLDDDLDLDPTPGDERLRAFKLEVSSSLRKRFQMDAAPERAVLVQQVASLLDPRHKNLAAEPSAAEADKARDFVRQKLQAEAGVAMFNQDAEDEGDTPAATNGLDFLFGGASAEAEGPRTRTWQAEYEAYLAEPQIGHNQCPLTWWKSHERMYPTLARLARRYLAVPASSASSERDFSTAGNTVRPNRSSLLPENVSVLVFLYQNRKVLLKNLSLF
ncbi:E3 SUMO-protein ligase ZBED1-like [Frankliniella occidentalis]|uniref:E3 SUMO-protein ligase ZBED1-like n=1 Tax=Frankliniella occidentalis TaxID=133901 RepID=A0A9C6XUT2_FRAOC|nr:E3 SUMO-protein ligase ZBED1-like [Frankliniella occidentalis]